MAEKTKRITQVWDTNAAIAFVKAWNAAASLNEVCTKLGLKTTTAQARARYCRKAGIPIKTMGGHSKPVWDTVKASISEKTP